jgi:hypothetical protein
MASRSQVAVLASAVTQAGTQTLTQTGVVLREAFREATVLLNVTAAATLVGDTLDVYIDTSCDGGTTWHNIGHFTQVLGNGGTKKFVMALRSDNPGASAVTDVTSDAAAGVTRQYGINDRLRARAITAGTGSFTYTVTALAK